MAIETIALKALTMLLENWKFVMGEAIDTLLAAAKDFSLGMSPKLGVMFTVLTNKLLEVMLVITALDDVKLVLRMLDAVAFVKVEFVMMALEIVALVLSNCEITALDEVMLVLRKLDDVELVNTELVITAVPDDMVELTRLAAVRLVTLALEMIAFVDVKLVLRS